MSQVDYFRTQRGLCHLLEDRIVFNQSSNPEELYDNHAPHSVVSPAWYGGVVLIIALFAYTSQNASMSDQELIWIVFLTIGVFYLAFWIYSHYDINHQQLIKREDIVRIKFKDAFMQRSYMHIVIYYRNPKGKIRRHFIILRPEKQGGPADLEQAKAIFERQGYAIS